MRVLQLVQRPHRRGAEMFAYDLSRRFEALGLTVRTVYLYRTGESQTLPMHDGDVVLAGHEGNLFERLPGLEPRLLRKVMREIREFRPDVVQVNGGRTIKYGAAAKRLLGSRASWKLVYRNIGIASFWHRWVGTVVVYRKVIMPQIDGIVGVSVESLEDVLSFYGLRAPSVVILNGVSSARLTPTASRAELRSALGVGEGEVVLLFVGKLDPVKRPDRFLRVLSRVRERRPGVRGWIVGDGPLREESETRAVDLGLEDAVRFFGVRNDVADLMTAADMLVMTSDSEGVPAVVIEAGLLGQPVVAMRVGGLGECVADGETGVLVPPGDEDGMAHAIDGLAADGEMRERLGGNAREWIRDQFTIEPVADRYLGFYRKLLGTENGERA